MIPEHAPLLRYTYIVCLVIYYYLLSIKCVLGLMYTTGTITLVSRYAHGQGNGKNI
jgi:hypothetical protein